MSKDRLNIIITKGGDKGTTSLGGGDRVSKSHPRLTAYGSADELNSFVGVVRQVPGLDKEVDACLEEVQHDLFVLGGELCFTPEKFKELEIPGMKDSMIESLESYAETFNEGLGPLKEFILPAGPYGAAELHVARTVCRRAERDLVTLAGSEEVRPVCLSYLNRLSDLLFILSRYVMEVRGEKPVLWNRER